MSAAGTLQAAKRHGWRETASRGSARQGIWKRQEDVAVWGAAPDQVPQGRRSGETTTAPRTVNTATGNT